VPEQNRFPAGQSKFAAVVTVGNLAEALLRYIHGRHELHKGQVKSTAIQPRAEY